MISELLFQSSLTSGKLDQVNVEFTIFLIKNSVRIYYNANFVATSRVNSTQILHVSV